MKGQAGPLCTYAGAVGEGGVGERPWAEQWQSGRGKGQQPRGSAPCRGRVEQEERRKHHMHAVRHVTARNLNPHITTEATRLLCHAAHLPFPSIQDRRLLQAAGIDLAAAAAAATLTKPPAGDMGATSSTRGLPESKGSQQAGWPLPLQPGAGGADAQADAVAQHARDMTEALRFRLGLKTALEGCLVALVGRAKELDALQAVR